MVQKVESETLEVINVVELVSTHDRFMNVITMYIVKHDITIINT